MQSHKFSDSFSRFDLNFFYFIISVLSGEKSSFVYKFIVNYKFHIYLFLFFFLSLK
jgi:hypothetical protein